MAKKITKNINSQFNPIYSEGFPMYLYGGFKRKYAGGGMLLSSLLGQGENIGQLTELMANQQNPNKANAGAALISGSLTGGPVKGLLDAFQAKSEFENEQNIKRQQQQELLKQQTIANLPSQPNYKPTFAKGGGIKIDPSKKGTFKAQADKMGMSVQEAASKILNAPEGKYSASMRKKANFAKNFAKANGGPIPDNYNNAWSQFYDLQPEYTKALAKKYPNIPIDSILSNSVADTSFRNTKVNDYANDLINQYGDFHLNNAEMDSIADANNTDIRDLERVLSKYDHKDNDKYIKTKGSKETNDMDYRFGPRMMLHRRYDSGNIPYKYLQDQNLLADFANGGPLNTGRVNRDKTSTFKTGGTHETSQLGGIPIGQNALVEEDEVKFDIEGGESYIFSNRIPYKKK